MFLIKIYIKESYINDYHTIIQMCGQYCILAPFCSSHYILTLLEDISPVLRVLVACSEVHTEFRSKYVCMVYCIDLLDYSDSSLV